MTSLEASNAWSDSDVTLRHGVTVTSLEGAE